MTTRLTRHSALHASFMAAERVLLADPVAVFSDGDGLSELDPALRVRVGDVAFPEPHVLTAHLDVDALAGEVWQEVFVGEVVLSTTADGRASVVVDGSPSPFGGLAGLEADELARHALDELFVSIVARFERQARAVDALSGVPV